MPRVADLPSHRLHIRLDKDDYDWMKRELGDDRLISETIRHLIKDLRKRYSKRPNLEIFTIPKGTDQ